MRVFALIWAASCLVMYVWAACHVYGVYMDSPTLRDAVRDGWRARLLRSALTTALPADWSMWRLYLMGPLGLLAMAYAWGPTAKGRRL